MPNAIQPNFELRSEEVQEIISSVPTWLVRWGITVFFLLLTLVIFASWIIHYPDLVKAPFLLNSLNAPKSVNSKINGKLVRLLVKDQAVVKEGQVLAYLESTADHKEVLALGAQLDTIRENFFRNDLTGLVKRGPVTYRQLGEIQADYQVFDRAYTQFIAYQAGGFYPMQQQLLQKELDDLIGLEKNLVEQKQIYQHDWDIAQQEFAIQKSLAEQKVIAEMDLKREESKLLAKHLPLKQIESALLQNHTSQSAKRKELLELNRLTGEQRALFLQSLQTLRSAVDRWKSQFVLIAPIAGRMYFSTLLEEKQTITANQEVFFIGSPSNQYFGEARVPQQNLGKVVPGQLVLIKFSSYPFQEFGQVEGRITSISEVPSGDGTFLVKFSLPNGLVTNYGKKLAYKTGMSAIADIITEDKRLIERLFYHLHEALAR